MTEEKYHKRCGGRVVYKEAIDQHFDYAGYCLKCDDDSPITQEDIIFKLEDGRYEILLGKKWVILEKEQINEIVRLEGV